MTTDTELPVRQLYEREDVERMLGYLFHGGQQWSREDAPDADMPRSRGNPATKGTHLAAMVDMSRAVTALVQLRRLRNPQALWLYYAEGWTQKDIANRYRISQPAVQQALDYDVGTIRDAMLEGLRPGLRGGLWPRH